MVRRLGQAFGILFFLCAPSAPALGKDIVESFTSPATVYNGAKVGSCGQLTALLAGAGQIAIPGNGLASFSTAAAADAAILASTEPLNPSGFVATVHVTNFAYSKLTQENGVTLLGLANTTPLAADDQWWANYRVLAVELNVLPTSTTNLPLYVSYWDDTTVYSWDGNGWQAGEQNRTPLLDLDPTKTYGITLDKVGSWYTVTVQSEGQTLIQAKVQDHQTRPAPISYLVVGDRLTNYFSGSMDLVSLSMPWPPTCVPPTDGGPPDTSPGSPDSGLVPNPDGPVALDDAQSPVSDSSTSPFDAAVDHTTWAAWDLFMPDMGDGRFPSSGDGCGCRTVGSAPDPAVLALLLLTLVVWRRSGG